MMGKGGCAHEIRHGYVAICGVLRVERLRYRSLLTHRGPTTVKAFSDCRKTCQSLVLLFAALVPFP